MSVTYVALFMKEQSRTRESKGYVVAQQMSYSDIIVLRYTQTLEHVQCVDARAQGQGFQSFASAFE